MTVLRYIHLNPVKAGLVTKPQDWRWSGHSELSGRTESNFLECGFALGFFGQSKREAQVEYAQFVEGAVDNQIQAPAAENCDQQEPPEKHINPGKPTMDEVARAIAVETGIALPNIKGRSRIRPISAARRRLVARLSEEGYSGGEIADFLDCSRSGISWMLGTALALDN